MARREKSRDRAKEIVSEASYFFTQSSNRYKVAYNLPYARMPIELLIDANLADAFSHSVQIISESDDQKAVDILNDSIERIERAAKLAKSSEDQRKRVEGARYDLLAKRCIRSVSLYREERKKQEELLRAAIDDLITAAWNFEGLHSDKTAASCQGCACLYKGLKIFEEGIMSNKLKLIGEAHEEFKRAAYFYQKAESELGNDVILTIDDVITGMEAYYDKLNNALNAGRTLGTVEYLPLYETINILIEQISAVGLKNLFKAYIFDEAMELVDTRKPKEKGGVRDISAIRDEVKETKEMISEGFKKSSEEHEEMLKHFQMIEGSCDKIIHDLEENGVKINDQNKEELKTLADDLKRANEEQLTGFTTELRKLFQDSATRNKIEKSALKEDKSLVKKTFGKILNELGIALSAAVTAEELLPHIEVVMRQITILNGINPGLVSTLILLPLIALKVRTVKRSR